mgnify:CR=1 FL=1
MGNKILTVIIPIYNSEKFLPIVFKCIEKRNESIEVILVNDGSTDSSEKLCNEFMKHSTNVKYIYQENAGVSAARNRGLENAKGIGLFSWIAMIS